MKKEKKIKRKPKHQHDLMAEPCSHCGYQEGTCEICGQELYTDDDGKTYHRP